VIYWTINSDSI